MSTFTHLDNIDTALNKLSGVLALAQNHVLNPLDVLDADALGVALRLISTDLERIREANDAMIALHRKSKGLLQAA
ncbi:hypothetical protein [Pusillimonas noertemannii]|uniref:Uncharacterized protein n=1 Tax=Pusillimonas noertemannii TaxID=305977 RepID=A0A2U1CNX2_9BURK|nr:hypothetical protein [Pusillimonas noertemannii]NYT68272.1 hypothetical protein [Pusillimonas noertemannii]PVY62713.1 hypothetical protein C7440_2209 [Pusillimonas noertemannii]TFL10349.1 hypothetical protein CSC72_07355 [Pusillimonas noertemannii]